MKGQQSLNDIEYGMLKHKIKREVFLDKMESVIHWDKWCAIIEPFYYKGEPMVGRPEVSNSRYGCIFSRCGSTCPLRAPRLISMTSTLSANLRASTLPKSRFLTLCPFSISASSLRTTTSANTFLQSWMQV